MTEILRAYSHPLISRHAFLAELQWHQDHDRIVAGAYGTGTDDTFRGCAVGCSLHSIKKIAQIKGPFGYSDHTQYPVYLGIPEVLARLQDQIFENLPADLRGTFPIRFSAAIQQDADLSGVWPKFAARILREIVIPTIRPEFDYVRVVVARVAAGWETNWADDTPSAAWNAAESAATSAARSAARSAAYQKMADILCEELALAPVKEICGK